eukprot:SAG11_NODE_5348_length_1588_cov_1.796508_1_plen_136_part_00
MVGQDRPRSEYPMPWGPKYWGKAYVKDPTMEELENHVTDGLKFVCVSALLCVSGLSDWRCVAGVHNRSVASRSENPESVETNMMLLSAWNEHDEGHWIEPALEKYGGAEKLEAIKKAIDKAETRRQVYWATVGRE